MHQPQFKCSRNKQPVAAILSTSLVTECPAGEHGCTQSKGKERTLVSHGKESEGNRRAGRGSKQQFTERPSPSNTYFKVQNLKHIGIFQVTNPISILVLKAGAILSPADTRQCLKTLLVVPVAEGRCSWHLLGGDQECCSASYSAQDRPTTENDPA